MITARLRVSKNLEIFMEFVKLLQRKWLKILVFLLQLLSGCQSFVMTYLHLPLQSLSQFVSNQLQKN